MDISNLSEAFSRMAKIAVNVTTAFVCLTLHSEFMKRRINHVRRWRRYY